MDEHAIDDLRARIRATRWATPADGSGADVGWSLGADAGTLRRLADYWADGFDWAAQRAAIDRLPHRRVTVGGIGVTLIHARAAGGHGLPLLLNHGWPDSSWRYRKVVPLLSDPAAHGGDPADAFDVIVPDLPGFGRSDPPPGAALNSREVAALWAELMTALGYDRFVTAGGDLGSHVSRYLALDHPERVIAVHRTDAGLPAPGLDTAALTPEERDWIAEVARWSASEGGYAAMHRTKPQTIAAALSDSPVGLLAWIAEKLHAWSDGDLLQSYSMDEVLTLVTEYWLNNAIGASMRMYAANAALPPEQLARRVEVPSGFSLFAGDIVRPPRAWMERTANTVWVSEPEHGGHFAPFEQPDAYTEQLRTFFRRFRPVS
ncbi:alpha/beta fold hydrolase [Microbacteriaceae bacterium VKM Ac-2854]|nr:alpha/beta fold hydrolase [Microbacteriaceae bacterium VKM Ac-2854]